MGLLNNPFTRTAVIIGGLSGCVTGGTSGPAPIYSPNEAAASTGAVVGGLGVAACQFIDDSNIRRACFAAAAAAATASAANARARAATAGSCDQYDNTRRSAGRDNTTGRVTYDRTTQTREEECRRRTPHRGGPRPGNIF